MVGDVHSNFKYFRHWDTRGVVEKTARMRIIFSCRRRWGINHVTERARRESRDIIIK